jgi:hypothetical protein
MKNKGSKGPFDEEVSEEQFVARRTAQTNIIAAELGNVDLAAEYPKPAYPGLSESLGWGYVEKRISAAHQRLQQVLAFESINELQPTSRSRVVALEPFDALSVYKTEELESLPKNIARWWRVNVKHQPGVADAIANFELDVKRCTSILHFGFYWGELCMYYAETIDWRMIGGTSYFLAEGYAAAHLPYTAIYDEFLSRIENATDDEKQAFVSSLTEKKKRLEQMFYSTFPRDDIFGDLAAAKVCKKILATPKSRRGTWKDR